MKPLQLDEHAAWKQRFRAPWIAMTQIAPLAPTRGLVLGDQAGVSQVYAWDVPSGALRQLTTRETGVGFVLLSPDGRYVYFLNDDNGNEIGHWVRVPYEGGVQEDLTPNLPLYSSSSVPIPASPLTISGACNRLAFNMADDEGYHLCCIDLRANSALGTPRMIYTSKRLLQNGSLLSHDGEVAVVVSVHRTDKPQSDVLAIDAQTGESIGELSDAPNGSVEPIAFAPRAGDFRLLARSNRSGDYRPLIWNARTGERTDIALSELVGEVTPINWSPDAQRVLLCQIHQSRHQLFLYHLPTERQTPLAHRGGSFMFAANLGVYFASDEEIFAQWVNSTQRSQVLAFDARTGEQTRVVLAPSDAPAARAWRSVTFTSSDGQDIHAWLATPEGDGPYPTILHMHGGPAAVMRETYLSTSQVWLDHGFVFMTINYRGSTTFGRDFQEKIFGDAGHWEIEDVVAARNFLVRKRIAHPEKILLMGGSYGGYLTLLALGKQPDLWAGGMARVAIADWTTIYEDESAMMRGLHVALFKGTPQEKPAQHIASSPITYATQVRAPVLVIQSENDTRCPPRQMRLYEERMKALSKDIEVHWFVAGHGSLAVEQVITHQELMLKFAYRVVG